MKSERLYCNKQDHDGGKMKCGYPLPCPWHTVVVELSPTRIKSPIPIHGEKRRRIVEVADVLDPDTWK